MKPTLYVGYKRQLTVNDLDDIPHVDKELILFDRLSSYDWSSTTTLNIVWKEFGKDYIFASLFLIPYFITCIAQPLLFRQTLLNVMNEYRSHTISYVYAILLFVSIILQALTHRQNIFRAARVAIRILNAPTMIIYTHALSLKLASLAEMDPDQVMNFGFESIGDFIMIGENGIILSSGQKARVSFACTLHANVAIYLLDDPLSVVDHRVAQQIYERCIGPCELLKNKTRLLTTHQAQFLSESNQIIFLSHGHIDKQSCLNENNIREKLCKQS
ncbi:unnamed protein product [Rotaria sp. Silwood1]|nr:unnamed protein product [Rotaria sp. Silwood1]